MTLTLPLSQPIIIIEKVSPSTKMPQKRETFPLMKDRTTIGNSEQSDIQINDPFISRDHCVITMKEKGIYITDLGSTNGTFVNKSKITDTTPIKLDNGDTIDLATKVTLSILTSGNPEQNTLNNSRASEIQVLPLSREVYIQGKLVNLSALQFNILEFLYKKMGDAVSKDDIAIAGWPKREPGDVSNQEIEQIIRRIRRKIEPDSKKPRYIITMKGYGYKMPKID